MRRFPAMLVTAILCLPFAACGGGGVRSPPRSPAYRVSSTGSPAVRGTAAPVGAAAMGTSDTHRDSDGDADANSHDDNNLLPYDRAATPPQRHAIVPLVERYFAAMVADDGATGCQMLYELLEESIVDEAATGAAPRPLRGKTCPQVLTKLFRARHSYDRAQLASMVVAKIRIEGRRGYATVRFRSDPSVRLIHVHLQFGVWKIDSVFDSGLP